MGPYFEYEILVGMYGDSKKLENGLGVIYAGVPFSSRLLGLETSHIPTFWFLLSTAGALSSCQDYGPIFRIQLQHHVPRPSRKITLVISWAYRVGGFN